MTAEEERERLIAEKAQLEAELGEIRQRKNARELEIIRKQFEPRDDFRLRREIELEARQAATPARERVAEIAARLQEIGPKRNENPQAETLRAILQALVDIRDAIKSRDIIGCDQ